MIVSPRRRPRSCSHGQGPETNLKIDDWDVYALACSALDLKRRFDWGQFARGVRHAPRSDRGATPKKATPRSACEGAAGRQGKIPAATYSPTRKPCSTIGSGGLNCRVRDGNGWSPSDVATGKPGRLHREPASSVGRLATDVATGKFAYAQAMCRVGRRKPRSTLALSIWNEGDGREERPSRTSD